VSDPQNAIAGALGTDPSAPNAARIYDYLLAGQDNYDADRQAARRLLRAVPEARQGARDNRAYLTRVTRWLAWQGITQYIDIGSGLPAQNPVHEVARKVCPGARVAYVDHDDVVVAHARAILADTPGLAAVQADLRWPRDLLTQPALRDVIDLTRPAAVLLIAIAHFLTDDDRPGEIIQAITERMAPGSYLAISHVTADDITPGAQKTARAAYDGASVPVQPRSRADVQRLLAGLDIVPPGITDVRAWRRPGRHSPPVPPVMFWAGAARVPGPRHPGQPPAERSSPP
jgi:hypothetical protein